MWSNGPRWRLSRVLLRGMPLGFLCAALTIAYEEKFEVYKHHDHHGDDHGHGHH